MKKQDKKPDEKQQRISELTLDLQRTRADFENFRKRVDTEKAMARANGRISAIMELLPLLDTIERAVNHMPAGLSNNPWAQGITGLGRRLEKAMKELGISKIVVKPGDSFNPDLHEAVQFDEAEGEHEVIAEELQAGYKLGDDILRHSMVKVTRK